MMAALDDLERRVASALVTDDRSDIDVLGYGEISTVLRLEVDGVALACKRLPPFPGDSLRAYRDAMTAYIAALANRGLVVASSTIERTGDATGGAVYCVQPIEERLLVDHLRQADAEEIAALAERLISLVMRAIDDRVGLDAQISNWAIRPGGNLVYFDVTTPFIRDEAGNEMLDFRLVIASLPAFMRLPVRRFLLPEILSHYYDPRAALLDLVANLKKEKLAHVLPAFLAATNDVVSPPIMSKEVDRYYRSDAVMWEILQRLRRADRWWQRTIRRRQYPFLLPGKVDR
jgi:hypothetical protein